MILFIFNRNIFCWFNLICLLKWIHCHLFKRICLSLRWWEFYFLLFTKHFLGFFYLRDIFWLFLFFCLINLLLLFQLITLLLNLWRCIHNLILYFRRFQLFKWLSDWFWKIFFLLFLFHLFWKTWPLNLRSNNREGLLLIFLLIRWNNLLLFFFPKWIKSIYKLLL